MGTALSCAGEGCASPTGHQRPTGAGRCWCLSPMSPRSKNLTWRDMQHLVVHTSKPAHLNANDWVTNGVGRKGTGVSGMEQGLPFPGCWGRAPWQPRGLEEAGGPMSHMVRQGTCVPWGPGSGADPVSVFSICSQPLVWLRPAGRWGHGQPGQELDHSGTSEEMCHRCPHGAQVRAGEPRGASPRICPVHGPALKPEHLWV